MSGAAVKSGGVGLSQGKPGLFTQWREDIASVFQRDPAARNVLEVLSTYPGVHAVMMHRITHRLWLRGWHYLARLLSFAVRLFSNVDIHPGATIGARFFIDHGAGVVIGETAVIGDDVTLYHGVTLGGTSWNKGKRHPTLGDGVMVGAGAKILGNIQVGDHSRVGANSVVVEDVPESCTVVGIPGKVVKLREAGVPNPYGIDLDHHLIPDPVGKAISCLLNRIDALEQLVEAGMAAAHYDTCDVDNQICESDCPGGVVSRELAREVAVR
ncbi:MAG: serine O-acetyltransferase [Gammaproteobacteria bacterium]|nr:MAG: serine O-acetyltransferase [Gammaproteobacteria bacterium]